MKCAACGLVNFNEAVICGRCGRSLGHSPNKNSRKEPLSGIGKAASILYTLTFLVAIAVAVFYFYGNSKPSEQPIQAMQANRAMPPPNSQPQAGLSRTEHDRARTVPFANAIKENPDLKASQQRTAETEKLMQSVSNK